MAVATSVRLRGQHGLDLSLEQRLGAHLRGEEAGLDRRRDVETLAQALDKVHVPGWQGALQGVDAGLLRHLGRQHQVDAVGLSGQPCLNLLDDVRNLLGQLARQAQHGEAPRLGDSDHHVGGMRKAEDRVRDAKLLTDGCADVRHGGVGGHRAHLASKPACFITLLHLACSASM
jgi:hypothetical protein